MADTYVQVNIVLSGRDTDQIEELTTVRLQESPVESAISLLSGVGSGAKQGRVSLIVANDQGTPATTTIACTHANAAGDKVTCNLPGSPVDFTEGVDFVRGSNDTDTAANLAVAINAHKRVSKFCAASAATGTVTLTCQLGHFGGIIRDIDWTTDDATAFNITNAATADATTTTYGVIDKS